MRQSRMKDIRSNKMTDKPCMCQKFDVVRLVSDGKKICLHGISDNRSTRLCIDQTGRVTIDGNEQEIKAKSNVAVT